MPPSDQEPLPRADAKPGPDLASHPVGQSRPLRVFISSASGALDDLTGRRRWRCATGLGRSAGASWRSSTRSGRRPSRCAGREVEGCDVLVLLLAHRYGQPAAWARPALVHRAGVHGGRSERPGMRLLPVFVVDPAFAVAAAGHRPWRRMHGALARLDGAGRGHDHVVRSAWPG